MRFVLLILYLLIPVSAGVTSGDLFDVDLRISNSINTYPGDTLIERNLVDSFTMEVQSINEEVVVKKFIDDDLGVEFNYDILTVEKLWAATLGFIDNETATILQSNTTIDPSNLIWIDPIGFEVLFNNSSAALSYFFNFPGKDEILEYFDPITIYDNDNEITLSYNLGNSTDNPGDFRYFEHWVNLEMTTSTTDIMIRQFMFSRSFYLNLNDTSTSSDLFISFEINNHNDTIDFPFIPFLVLLVIKRRSWKAKT